MQPCHPNGAATMGNPGNKTSYRSATRDTAGLIRNHLFLRKKKFWNAAIASGDRIRSPKK
jgi:hypothetical protein